MRPPWQSYILLSQDLCNGAAFRLLPDDGAHRMPLAASCCSAMVLPCMCISVTSMSHSASALPCLLSLGQRRCA